MFGNYFHKYKPEDCKWTNEHEQFISEKLQIEPMYDLHTGEKHLRLSDLPHILRLIVEKLDQTSDP